MLKSKDESTLCSAFIFDHPSQSLADLRIFFCVQCLLSILQRIAIRFIEINVVGEGHPLARCYFLHLVVGITEECDVGNVARVRCMKLFCRVEGELLAVVAKAQRASLMSYGKDNNKGCDHVFRARCIFMRLEETTCLYGRMVV